MIFYGLSFGRFSGNTDVFAVCEIREIQIRRHIYFTKSVLIHAIVLLILHKSYFSVIYFFFYRRFKPDLTRFKPGTKSRNFRTT